jgi:hypothetical protein
MVSPPSIFRSKGFRSVASDCCAFRYYLGSAELGLETLLGAAFGAELQPKTLLRLCRFAFFLELQGEIVAGLRPGAGQLCAFLINVAAVSASDRLD